MFHTRTSLVTEGGAEKPILSHTLQLAMIFVTGLALMVIPAVPASAADCPDADEDGYHKNVLGCTVNGTLPGDCDDSDEDINPAATERCDDDIDNDCDGAINEGFHIGEPTALCVQVPTVAALLSASAGSQGLTATILTVISV